MNQIEANLGNVASPAVSTGLEMSGQKSASLTSRIIKANFQTVGSLVLMASAVACGSSKDAKISTPSATSNPTTPVATEARTPAATPKVEVTVTPAAGPTEAAKAQVREQIPVTLKTISTEVISFQKPLDLQVSPELFKQRQQEVAVDVEVVNSALAKGDIDGARSALIRLKSNIWQLGDPLKGILPSKELKAQHDPQDKYLKFDDIDPAIEKPYLSVIDMLVATDSSYAPPGK